MNTPEWIVCTRIGWQNRQSVNIGPLIVWVIQNKQNQLFDIEIRTQQHVQYQAQGIYSESEAKDHALKAVLDLLSCWSQTVTGYQIALQKVA